MNTDATLAQILRFVGRLIGILIAIGIGFVVIQMALIYLEAWWTGRSPAFYWP